MQQHEATTGDFSPHRAMQIAALVDDHRRRLAAGDAVSDDALLAAHPDLMPELGAELRKLRLSTAAGAKVVQPIGTADTRSHRDVDTGSGHLDVRCPNCHTSMEVAVDTQLTDLTCGSCGSHFSLVDQRQATRMAPPLSTMGRFELIERLGVGGYGSVWKARDQELDRTVAIKIPRQGAMTAEEQEKFFREARAAAQLRHRGIISVHEVGRDGDSVYIVSDFVRGVTLSDWLTGQQVTSREAAELCAKIADALHHAHEHGVVHRDLKPANIIVDGDGEPHLMDFGLARREVGEVTVTVDGQVLGTPAYMSPEQAQGEAHKADRRSDVYSLGVIMFQLLTGELPFRGNARMLIHQVINDPAPSPRKFNGNVPKDFETITLKCLEKEPTRRYQKACDLHDELTRYLNGEPIKARPVGGLERGWSWCRRYPAMAGLSAAVVLSLLAGTFVSTLLYVRAERSRRLERQARVEAVRDSERAEHAEGLAEGLRKTAEDALLESQKSAYFANLRLAQDAFDAGGTETARTSLARCPEPLRNWEWYCLNWRLDQSLKTSHDHAAYVTAIAFTPDGRQVVSGSVDHTMRVWDISGNDSSEVRAKFDASVQDLTLSPDGQWIAVARRDGPVEIWSLEDGSRKQSLIGHDREACAVAFSPDGSLLVSGGGAVDQSVRVWDWKAGRELHVGKKHVGKVWAVSFSPDGKTIASGGYDGSVRTWDAVTGKHLQHLGEMADLVNSIAFSPDGARLAAACNDGSISVWRIDSSEELFQEKLHSDDVNVVVFSPDGKFLATGSKDGSIAICDAANGLPLNRLVGHAESVIDLAFSPDGTRLASCGRAGEVKLWDPYAKTLRRSQVAANGEVGVITMLPGRDEFVTAAEFVNQKWQLYDGVPELTYDRSVSDDARASLTRTERQRMDDFAVSRDGTLIADTAGKTIKIMDVASGRNLREIPMPCTCLCLTFSPDNRIIYAAGKETKIGDRDEILVHAYDVKDGRKVWQSSGHAYWVYAIAASPDGNEVWSSGDDRFILVRNARTGELLRKITGHSQTVWDIEFAPDGKLAASASDGVVYLWDPLKDRALRTLRSEPGRVRIAFHPAEPRLASLGRDGLLRIWDTHDGLELLKCDIRARHQTTLRELQEVTEPSAEQSANGGYLNQLVSRLGGRPIDARALNASPISLAFSLDGSTLLVGDSEGRIWYWQTINTPRQDLQSDAAVARGVPHVADVIRGPQRLSDRASNAQLQAKAEENPFDTGDEAPKNAPAAPATPVAAPKPDPAPDPILTGLLNNCRESAEGVTKSVAIARATPRDKISTDPCRVFVGELSILDERPDEGVEIIGEAIRNGLTAGYAQKSYGWALWAAGRQPEATAAFQMAIANVALDDADLDQWAAAFLLGRVSEEEFVERALHASTPMEAFAWFYIGQRREHDGAAADAIVAYEKSVAADRQANIKRVVSHWSAYRIGRLKSPSENATDAK